MSRNMPEPIFSVKDLTFGYDNGHVVLDGVNLAVFPGQCLGVRGSNGSGKTTLFRCITGLEKPGSGSIWLGDRQMRSERDFRELRCQVGYVLQDADDQLFFPTVMEDISFGPLNLGLPEKDAAELARECLDLVCLSGFENRITHHLSGGEKKLVSIAAVLAMRPRAILLDEPLNGLDTKACKLIADIIGKMDCARIIISHDRDLLTQVRAECMLLEKGRLSPLPDN